MRTFIPLLVIAVVLGAGWHFREPIKLQLGKAGITLPGSAPVVSNQPPVEDTASKPRKDTVYRWVDENGITHFDQQATAGSQAVEVDQSRIQSLNNYGMPATQPAEPAAAGKSDAQGRSPRPIDRLPQAQAAPI